MSADSDTNAAKAVVLDRLVDRFYRQEASRSGPEGLCWTHAEDVRLGEVDPEVEQELYRIYGKDHWKLGGVAPVHDRRSGIAGEDIQQGKIMGIGPDGKLYAASGHQSPIGVAAADLTKEQTVQDQGNGHWLPMQDSVNPHGHCE